MTEMNPDTGLASLAQRLNTLDASLTQAVRRSRSRNVGVLVVMVLSIVFFCFYLGYAYHRYANEVNPDLVASSMEASLMDSAPSARLQLEANLKSNAPQYVNKAMDQLEDMSDRYASSLQSNAEAAMDKSMPELSDELYKSLKTTLDQAKQSPMSGTDDQKFQATLASLGQVYADETLKLVDQAHKDYSSQAVDFTDYLQRLGKNEDLDERDQMHRELFRNVMLLIRERSSGAAGSQLDTSTIAPGK